MNRISKVVTVFITVTSILLVLSCRKKDTTIGIEVYDPEMLLDANGVDTFSVMFFSELLDSAIITKNSTLALLGNYNDPVFGEVTAGFSFQLRLQANNPNFEDLSVITLDSVVLALEYREQYGAGGVLPNIQVYKLTEDLNSDELYTSESVIATDEANNPQGWIHEDFVETIPNVKKPFIDQDSVVYQPQMRLRLKNELGWELLNASEEGHLLNNDAFLDFFKGFQVVTKNENLAEKSGAIYSFDLRVAPSKLTLYYRQHDTIRRSFDFVINNNSIRYNQLQYNYANTPLYNLLNNPNLGLKEFYCQSGNVRAVVQMPTVQNLSNKTVVQRATLYLPVQYFPNNDKYVSPRIFATNRRENDSEAVWGLQQDGSGFFIPISYPFVNTFKGYIVDVTTFVQGLIKQNPSYQTPELRITSLVTNDNVERIIFNGLETTNKFKPRLIITYTEF